jgi:hypothetical protein
MKTQMLCGAGKAALSPVVLCCLGAFVVPTDARAQQISNPVCTLQSVTKGGVTIWQIKGTASVTGLPVNPPKSTVKVTVWFQKSVNGGAWVNVMSVTQGATAPQGTANIDTGFQDLNGASTNPCENSSTNPWYNG